MGPAEGEVTLYISLLQLSSQRKLGPLAYLTDFLALGHSVRQLPGLRWAQSTLPDISAAFSINNLILLQPHFLHSPVREKTVTPQNTAFFPAQSFCSSVSVSHFMKQKTIPFTKMMEVPLLKSCLLINGHAAV